MVNRRKDVGGVTLGMVTPEVQAIVLGRYAGGR